MKSLLSICFIGMLSFGCKEKTTLVDFSLPKTIESDTLFVGWFGQNPLKLKPPYKVVYQNRRKGDIGKGKIYYGDSLILHFDLNINLVENNEFKPDLVVVSDTLSSSLWADKTIFSWYIEKGIDCITVQHIGMGEYLIHGCVKSEKSTNKKLQYLYSEIRRVTIQHLYKSDSTFIKNLSDSRI